MKEEEARLPIKAGKSELDLHYSFTDKWRARIRQAASKALCGLFYSKAEAIKRGSALGRRKK